MLFAMNIERLSAKQLMIYLGILFCALCLGGPMGPAGFFYSWIVTFGYDVVIH